MWLLSGATLRTVNSKALFPFSAHKNCFQAVMKKNKPSVFVLSVLTAALFVSLPPGGWCWSSILRQKELMQRCCSNNSLMLVSTSFYRFSYPQTPLVVSNKYEWVRLTLSDDKETNWKKLWLLEFNLSTRGLCFSCSAKKIYCCFLFQTGNKNKFSNIRYEFFVSRDTKTWRH